MIEQLYLEGVQLIQELADGLALNLAMKNVILPKIRDHDERTRVRTILDNV